MVHIHRIWPKVSEKISSAGRCQAGGAHPPNGSTTPWNISVINRPNATPCHSLILGKISARKQYAMAKKIENR
ncbi:hypothetical protein D3C79_1070070 [compost metagenome]